MFFFLISFITFVCERIVSSQQLFGYWVRFVRATAVVRHSIKLPLHMFLLANDLSKIYVNHISHHFTHVFFAYVQWTLFTRHFIVNRYFTRFLIFIFNIFVLFCFLSLERMCLTFDIHGGKAAQTVFINIRLQWQFCHLSSGEDLLASNCADTKQYCWTHWEQNKNRQQHPVQLIFLRISLSNSDKHWKFKILILKQSIWRMFIFESRMTAKTERKRSISAIWTFKVVMSIFHVGFFSLQIVTK